MDTETHSSPPAEQQDGHKVVKNFSHELLTLTETVVVKEILSIIDNKSIATFIQNVSPKVCRSFNLKNHFCRHHGCRLDPKKIRKGNDDAMDDDYNEGGNDDDDMLDDLDEAEEEEEENPINVEEMDEETRRGFEKWKCNNPFLHPKECYPCRMAEKGREFCGACNLWKRWDNWLQCDICQGRLCTDCARLGLVCMSCGQCPNCAPGAMYQNCEWCHDRVCGRNANPNCKLHCCWLCEGNSCHRCHPPAMPCPDPECRCRRIDSIKDYSLRDADAHTAHNFDDYDDEDDDIAAEEDNNSDVADDIVAEEDDDGDDLWDD